MNSPVKHDVGDTGLIWGLPLYLQPRLLIVFVMGFASGLPLALSSATLFFWLAETGVTLAAIGLFALVGAPYNFKFLWAPFIDRVPLPGLTRLLGRRRSWMLVIQIGLMLAIAVLGFSQPETTPLLTAVCALAVAFFSASQDIVIDAYRIEILDRDEQGAGAAMTQAGYRLGAIAAGAGALFLAEQIDWSLVYAVMAALVIVGMAAAILAPDPERRNPELVEKHHEMGFRSMIVDPFVEFFQRNGPATAILILAFILLYKFGDAYAGVMAYPFYYEMGFTKSEVATVSKIFGVIVLWKLDLEALLIACRNAGETLLKVGQHLTLPQDDRHLAACATRKRFAFESAFKIDNNTITIGALAIDRFPRRLLLAQFEQHVVDIFLADSDIGRFNLDLVQVLEFDIGHDLERRGIGKILTVAAHFRPNLRPASRVQLRFHDRRRVALLHELREDFFANLLAVFLPDDLGRHLARPKTLDLGRAANRLKA